MYTVIMFCLETIETHTYTHNKAQPNKRRAKQNKKIDIVNGL